MHIANCSIIFSPDNCTSIVMSLSGPVLSQPLPFCPVYLGMQQNPFDGATEEFPNRLPDMSLHHLVRLCEALFQTDHPLSQFQLVFP